MSQECVKTSGANSSIDGTSDDLESPPPEERDTAMVNSDAVGDEVSPAPGIGFGCTRWTGVSSGNRPMV